jgi:1,2-phenylacetyl-CoA epoxidase catalytic subunit
VADGTLPEPSSATLDRWWDAVEAKLTPLGLPFDRSLQPDEPGGRQGLHTADFAELWQEMTALYRSDPAARW